MLVYKQQEIVVSPSLVWSLVNGLCSPLAATESALMPHGKTKLLDQVQRAVGGGQHRLARLQHRNKQAACVPRLDFHPFVIVLHARVPISFTPM